MERKAYEQCQAGLLSMSGLIGHLPLEEFLQAIDRAESIGPLVDPTLYRRGALNMEKIKKIAQAALKLKQVVKTERLIPNNDK